LGFGVLGFGWVAAFLRFENFEILVEHRYDVLDTENSTKSFVFPHEAESDEAVPLSEVDWWRRVLWLNAHHARFNLGWRLETVP